MAPARPDRHAQSDLARPLRHRHEHDVHDPDAADQERHRRDRGEQIGHHLGRLLLGLENLGEVPEPEVVVLERLQAMALTQERTDLILGLGHVLVRADLDRDGADGPGVRLTHAQDLLLRRGDRNQDHVVLILSPRVLPLPAQHPDDREGHLLDPNDLTERLGLAEEVERRGLAHERDLGGAFHVLGVDGAAVHDGPVARLEIIRRHPLDDRGPVQVAVDDLCRASHRGGGRLHERDLARDRGRVVLADRELAPRPEADPAGRDAPGEDDDEVRPETLDLLRDSRLGAGADADHGDDGGDADDDAEHRERAPELVHPERPACDADALPHAHAASSSSSAGSSASVAAASRGCVACSSVLRRPSRKVRLRLA